MEEFKVRENIILVEKQIKELRHCRNKNQIKFAWMIGCQYLLIYVQLAVVRKISITKNISR